MTLGKAKDLQVATCVAGTPDEFAERLGGELAALTNRDVVSVSITNINIDDSIDAPPHRIMGTIIYKQPSK